ncbi:hypothetical protein [Glaciihabitans sp. UYNi722]|uniref:hypothetical protein n=1 Tax=Glaciihabitans sp. UYNi722 TaxID=3156344 RepID=UPI0033996C14
MTVRHRSSSVETHGPQVGVRLGAGALSIVVVAALTGCIGAPSPAPSPWRTPGCSTAAPTASAEALPAELTTKLVKYGIWSQTWNDPPTKGDLAHPAEVPAGVDPTLKIWKSPILVAPGITGTVSIVSPSSARLFVTTWAKWEHLNGPEITAEQTSLVKVTGCNGIGSYPGLTIVRQPTCVVFGVKQEGEAQTKVPVPFFGGRC